MAQMTNPTQTRSILQALPSAEFECKPNSLTSIVQFNTIPYPIPSCSDHTQTTLERASEREMPPKKNFRKRTHDDDDDQNKPADDSDDELHRRMVLEEVKFLQKQRERKMGIPALPSAATDTGALPVRISGGRAGEGGGEEKDEQVLQDTFAQETAVTVEDPNMMKYVEQQLAKRRGKKVDTGEKEEKDEEVDELYVVPDHLKVKKRNQEQSTQWTTGIAEVQLPIEYKLKNIEETEAAKKQLQEKRLAGNAKPDPSIPASYSADYLHRGRDYAEKLRREHPELYKDGKQSSEAGTKPTEDVKSDNNTNGNNGNNNIAEGGKREAATDEFMLERFRKREKYRVMRR